MVAATCIRWMPALRPGRLLLTSFVWPFDLDRHVRLASALAIVAVHPLHIDQAPPVTGCRALDDSWIRILPVVWHSVTQLYWRARSEAAVEGILSHFGADHRAGRGESGVRLEWSARCQTRAAYAAVGPGSDGSLRQRLLGIAHDHGIPVRLSTTS